MMKVLNVAVLIRKFLPGTFNDEYVEVLLIALNEEIELLPKDLRISEEVGCFSIILKNLVRGMLMKIKEWEIRIAIKCDDAYDILLFY